MATDAATAPAARTNAGVGAGTGAGVTLKLYIDSTSLSVVHQMADFVACADAPDVIKIITWLRCPLSEAQLQSSNALYLQQLAAVNADFVGTVCQVVQRFGVQALEVHSNHHHARNGVLPVLRVLIARRQLDPAQIRLHLYDDGRLSVMNRAELLADPDLPAALQRGAAALRTWLLDGVAATWDLPTSYSWHHVFDTQYHMLRPELMQATPKPATIDPALLQAIVPMVFDHAQRLSPERWARYLQAYGLEASQRDTLRAFSADPASFIFVGTGVWDKTRNAHYAQRQEESIAALRRRGWLPATARMGFKNHPANLDHEARLARALGENVLTVPARLPLEVMMMDGLLPAQLGGVISTAYLTLPPGLLAFMLCDADTDAQAAAQPDVRLLVDLGLVPPERVLPWLQ